MDVVGCHLAARNVEIASPRRATADENRIPIVGQQRLEATDEFPETGFHPHVEDQVDLLVGDRFGQAKARDLRAHHAAALGVAVEKHTVVAERQQIACDGQRGGSGADEGDVLAVLFFFNDTATTEIYTLSLHDALPISVALPQSTPDVPSRPRIRALAT